MFKEEIPCSVRGTASLGKYYPVKVSNQLISLASREREEKRYQDLEGEYNVSNQLISLASRESLEYDATLEWWLDTFPIN